MGSKALATSLLFTINLLVLIMACSCFPSPWPRWRPRPPKTPTTPCVPKYSPPPPPPPPSTEGHYCPINILNLDVCADILGLVNITIGSQPTSQCCSLISGLADLDAAVCLCAAIKAGILGINLNIPISLSLILNQCGKDNSGYQCM